MRPTLLLIALVVALLPAALFYWRSQANRHVSGLHVTMVALGVALATLMLTVASTYAFRPLRVLQASHWLWGIPLLVYFGAAIPLGAKGKVEYGSLGIWIVVGLAPLLFLGIYAWLIAACSFGDCL